MTPQAWREGAGVESTPDSEAVASCHERAQQSAAETGAGSSGDTGQHGPDVGSTPFQSKGNVGLKAGERAAGCGAAGAAPAPAALPCQNSNNSDKKSRRYRLRPCGEGLVTNNEGRTIWEKDEDDDTLYRWGIPTGAEAKAAFHLRLNVGSFVEHWGRDHCLFFTVTDEANLHPTQFARRWNHYLRRHGRWMVSFIRVLEPQRQGRPHYHLLVAVRWNTRPDAFDWQAFDECQREHREHGPTARFRELRARYKASAAPELVALWSFLRKVLPRYGLGRAELLPIRKGKEAIAEYVGKYLEAGLVIRKHSWKGCRRVEFDRRAKTAWLSCTRVFAWHSPGAIAWRKRVGELGAALDVADMDGIRLKLGPKWAYRLREAITLAAEDDWQCVLQSLASGLEYAA
jgi:hypothetical protein